MPVGRERSSRVVSGGWKRGVRRGEKGLEASAGGEQPRIRKAREGGEPKADDPLVLPRAAP